MSIYRMTIEVDVDDELLADHDGDQVAPPNDVDDWYGGDLIAAVNAGLAEVVHDEVRDVERVG